MSLKVISALAVGSLVGMSGVTQAQSAVVKAEFIFETAPFPACHASTIAEAKNGLAAAWFGGKR